MLSDAMMARLGEHPQVAAALPGIEADVRAGRLLPTLAVEQVLALLER